MYFYAYIEILDHIINLIVKIKEDYSVYEEAIKSYEDLGEGSMRCYKCYAFRLNYASLYASNHNFDYYSTVMSVSPYKNSIWINEILKDNEIKAKALYSNFKKDNGYQETIRLSRKFDLYRQDYCGCKYSIKEHEERIK